MDRPWGLMRGAARAADAPRSIRPGTVGRIWRFAQPYRRWLLAFLLLTVVGAGIGVATPVLAGRVVNAIVAGGQVSAAAATVVGLAGGIAALAVLEAVTGLVSRWFSSRIGEGLIVDLRKAVYTHVQRMPVAFFTRTRTGALVSRLNSDVIGAQSAITSTLASVAEQHHPAHPRPGRDDRARLAGHGAGARAAADLRAARAADGQADRGPASRVGGPQRPDEQPDDRAVLRAGRDAGEAVRPARGGGPRVRRPRRAGARHRGAHGDGVAGVRHGALARLGARPGAGLRPRRLPGRHRRDRAGHRRHPGAAAHPALHADDGAGERAGGRHDRARVVRTGLRGARPAAAHHRAAGSAAAAGRTRLRPPPRRALRVPRARSGCRWRRWKTSRCSTAG